MNMTKLKDEIIADEGRKDEIYNCSMSVKTAGIGHAIRKSEPEYKLKLGTKVSDERIDEWFDSDIKSTIADVKFLFPNISDIPEEGQRVLANSCFQLGRNRLSHFVKLRKAVAQPYWWLSKEGKEQVAAEMRDSRWYKQTTNRVQRHIDRILAL